MTVLTNVKKIEEKCDCSKIDYLIKVFSEKSIFGALLCCPPLLMICYYTALAKGINPDENLIESLNIKNDLTSLE